MALGCSGGEDIDVGQDDDALATSLGYVRTPAGYTHKSCVHEVEDGATVDADGVVTRADTSTYALPKCAYGPLPTGGHPLVAKVALNGWVGASEWVSPSWIRKITADWVVPSAPAKDDNQLIYFFPSIEPLPTSPSPILQPVLQYGVSPAGGGAYWAIGSWNCHSAPGPCTHSAITKVAAGDKLYGSVSGSSCSAEGVCTWTITIKDETTGKSHSLKAKNDTETFRFAQGGAFEAYRITACNQLPAAGSLEFTRIKLYDENLAAMTPAWSNQLYVSSTICGAAVTSTKTTATFHF
jgi:hypothetical protein